MKNFFLLFLLALPILFSSQTYTIKIARVKYNGGGDWYANPTSLANLATFCNRNLSSTIDPNIPDVEVGSKEIFRYPFLHMTGHGNVVFSNYEAENLRKYLIGGGFLHIDDNYGMDKFIRNELKKVFPDKELVELPNSHAIYHQKFKFQNGLPKIHEHEGKPAQGFAIFHEERMVLFYTHESDLGDGWEDQAVHNDSEAIRTKALQMGANIIQFVFTQ